MKIVVMCMLLVINQVLETTHKIPVENKELTGIELGINSAELLELRPDVVRFSPFESDNIGPNTVYLEKLPDGSDFSAIAYLFHHDRLVTVNLEKRANDTNRAQAEIYQILPQQVKEKFEESPLKQSSEFNEFVYTVSTKDKQVTLMIYRIEDKHIIDELLKRES